MKRYVILLRGINVGGKGLVRMVDLKSGLEDLGFSEVRTYIASGNVILRSDMAAQDMRDKIEQLLRTRFNIAPESAKVLVLSDKDLLRVVAHKPPTFGDNPSTFHSDVIFLIDIDSKQAFAAFNPREGVDTVWLGKGVIYSERLSAKRTQSRLSTIAKSPLYTSMTIRSFNTVTKLCELLAKPTYTGTA